MLMQFSESELFQEASAARHFHLGEGLSSAGNLGGGMGTAGLIVQLLRWEPVLTLGTERPWGGCGRRQASSASRMAALRFIGSSLVNNKVHGTKVAQGCDSQGCLKGFLFTFRVKIHSAALSSWVSHFSP